MPAAASPASRPERHEYADFYANYVAAVPEGDVLATLERQGREVAALLAALPAGLQQHRYAPGKWSVSELLGHLVDAERIFSYRALRFARGDRTPLPGMDQDAYVAGGAFDRRPFQSLVEEAVHLRAANLALFASFDAQALQRSGEASGKPVSVRALLYIIAGHERHHVDVLKERYL